MFHCEMMADHVVSSSSQMTHSCGNKSVKAPGGCRDSAGRRSEHSENQLPGKTFSEPCLLVWNVSTLGDVLKKNHTLSAGLMGNSEGPSSMPPFTSRIIYAVLSTCISYKSLLL